MKKNYLMMAALVSVGMMTSCSSSDTEEKTAASSTPANVNISLASKGYSRVTGALPGTGVEDAINIYTVGLFDASNNRVTVQDVSTAYTSGKETQITTTEAAAKIHVAANTTSAALFDGCTNVSDFEGIKAQLSNTSSAPATVNSQSTNNLPMYGTATLPAFNANHESHVSVSMGRLVARVVLSSLKTQYASTSYDGATFEPQEIFMANVNTEYTYGGTIPTQTAKVAADIESTTNTGIPSAPVLANNTTLPACAYLSTGKYASTVTTTPTSDATYINSTTPVYFYVFPHDATDPTKIIIKGIFKTKAGAQSIQYYPIIINHGQLNTTIKNGDNNTTLYDGTQTYAEDSKIAANSTYNLDVTLVGSGVADPGTEIVPSNAYVTMTVTGWTGYNQTTIIK